MEDRKLLNSKLIFPLVMLILFGAISRLVPHPANFAPIGGMALFAGAYLPIPFAFFIPLMAVFLSDIFLGFYGSGMIYVYLSYILIGILGIWLKKNKNFKNVFLASIASSLLFFVVSNFGVWAYSKSMYSHDLNGLVACYINAIPFFRGTLLGDFTFTGIFFGGYELAKLVSKKYLPVKFSKLLF